MALIQTHKDLRVWQEAMTLAQATYTKASRFPRPDGNVLASQMRRSAVSVPSNIAEGAGRSSPRELAQFVNIASGSLAELDTQLQLAIRLGYIPQDDRVVLQLELVGKLLSGLRRSLRRSTTTND
jgi:four helix bundle protein